LQIDTVFGDYSRKIVIRARDGSWGPILSTSEGKQLYMSSAAESLKNQYNNVEITRNSTVLIDDDPNNIQISLNSYTRAILFKPYTPNQ
jgi:hypothetical protein